MSLLARLFIRFCFRIFKRKSLTSRVLYNKKKKSGHIFMFYQESLSSDIRRKQNKNLI